MGFVLVKEGVVVQKSCSPEEGFVEAPDDVVCCYLATEDGFVAPKQEKAQQLLDVESIPVKTLVDQILDDPVELAKLKAALGL